MNDMVEVEPGVYSVLIDGVSYEARISGDRVVVDGHWFTAEADNPRQWKRGRAGTATEGRASVIAPMPGKLVRVLVSVGDEVTAGQALMVVEAMKMQNELKAPRAGRVTSVNAKAGDSVNAGAVLAAIEQTR